MAPPLPQSLTLAPSLTTLSHRLISRGLPSSTLYHQRITWGHSDTFQHVNNVHYVRFFESSRMVWLENVARQLGDPKRTADLLQGRGVGMILAGINVRYRRPVTYPDSLLIGVQLTRPIAQGDDRFTLRAEAHSLKAWEDYEAKDKGTREPGPVCVAEQDCVLYDYSPQVLSKVAIPEDLRLAIEKASHADSTTTATQT